MGNAGVVAIYWLKVSLRGILPMVWPRLLVPDDLTPYGLHRIIQIAIGWEDYHLHAFRVHGRRYETMWSGERHYRTARSTTCSWPALAARCTGILVPGANCPNRR